MRCRLAIPPVEWGLPSYRAQQRRSGRPVDRKIDQLLAAGWELDSHSLTHPDLTQLAPKELEAQVSGSRRVLQRRFRTRVDFFCYPSRAGTTTSSSQRSRRLNISARQPHGMDSLVPMRRTYLRAFASTRAKAASISAGSSRPSARRVLRRWHTDARPAKAAALCRKPSPGS